MDKKLPMYKIVVLDDDELGVDFIAFVGDPATKRLWQTFKDKKDLFQVQNEDRRIISGALLVADLPIYRRDEEKGEYYVVFDKENIERIVHKFFKKGFQGNVNGEHEAKDQLDNCYMFESFLIDESRGIETPEGFDKLTDGSWFGSYKVEDKKIWDKFIKTGEFTGFSVEGFFGHQYLAPQEEDIIQEIVDMIQNSEQTFQRNTDLEKLPKGHPNNPDPSKSFSEWKFTIRSFEGKPLPQNPHVLPENPSESDYYWIHPPQRGEEITLAIHYYDHRDPLGRGIGVRFSGRRGDQQEEIPNGIYILDNGAKIKIKDRQVIQGKVNPWITGYERFKEQNSGDRDTKFEEFDKLDKAEKIEIGGIIYLGMETTTGLIILFENKTFKKGMPVWLRRENSDGTFRLDPLLDGRYELVIPFWIQVEDSKVIDIGDIIKNNFKNQKGENFQVIVGGMIAFLLKNGQTIIDLLTGRRELLDEMLDKLFAPPGLKEILHNSWILPITAFIPKEAKDWRGRIYGREELIILGSKILRTEIPVVIKTERGIVAAPDGEYSLGTQGYIRIEDGRIKEMSSQSFPFN